MATFRRLFASLRIFQTINSKRCVSHRPLGQPTSFTHPNLLKEGEILPGMKTSEFEARRALFMNELSKSDRGMRNKKHLVIIPSSTLKYRYTDIFYQFHQNPDFLYLCGFQEPDSVLLLRSDFEKGLPEHKSILYVTPRDPFHELWNGPVTGPDDAVKLLGIDEAYSINDLEKHLSENYSTQDCSVWHYTTEIINFNMQRKITESLTKHSDSKIKSVHNFVNHLQTCRAYKSDAEISLMRVAGDLTGEIFREAMRNTRPGMWEYQLESILEHSAKMGGAQALAFCPVVAGGERGNHIHYVRNYNQLSDGDMVLVDAGVQHHGYVSDVTRTWPVNGQFSPPQRELYEMLLQVQEFAIQKCKPGISLDVIHYLTTMKLASYLQELEIVKKNLSKEDSQKITEKLFPHHVGHYLGMETHDTAVVSRRAGLQANMVITIEPGVYLRGNMGDNLLGPRFKHYKGLAVRIEDDVLITVEGCEVLSKSCPKGVEDVELTMLKQTC